LESVLDSQVIGFCPVREDKASLQSWLQTPSGVQRIQYSLPAPFKEKQSILLDGFYSNCPITISPKTKVSVLVYV
jgi:hypothetical protein